MPGIKTAKRPYFLSLYSLVYMCVVNWVLVGVARIIGSFCGGLLSGAVGIRTVFLYNGGFIFAALFIFAILFRRADHASRITLPAV